MKQFQLILFYVLIISLIIFIIDCTPPPQKPIPQLYTAYNIWYEKPAKLYAINYKKGMMIPAGTEVKFIKTGFRRLSYLEFKTVSDNQSFRVYLEERFQPGLNIFNVHARMFSKKTFEEQTKDFTPEEVKAIREAKVIKGMSKEALIMSLGYPPKHMTPSLERDYWQYWKNRFKSFAVNFDENGLVSKDVDWVHIHEP